ncbi:hypothetical protein E4T44_12314, partial [Aureobasidium sp. EXF-8845]
WHTTELVKHLDKCAQYTPSKRQKYTRPWRIEQPGNARSPNQPQSQQPSPQQLHFDPANRNVRVAPNAVFQWDNAVAAGRPLTTNNSDSRSGDDNHHVDALQERDQQPQPQPQHRPQQQQPNHHTLHTPSQSLGNTTDYTPAHNTPNLPSRPPPLPTSTAHNPPPISDPDPRLHSFIEYERGATAWQTRPEDLDTIEIWLQYHRIDIEDIKEITEGRWVDHWGLKLGDLYRVKRDVQTFKVFATR